MANLSRARKHFSDDLLHPELSTVATTNQDYEIQTICDDVSVASRFNHNNNFNDHSNTDISLDSEQMVNDNLAFEPVNKRQKLLSDHLLSKSNALHPQSITYFGNEVKQTGQGICGLVSSAKYSIFQNLPCPKVIQIDNHACVRIESALDHVLAIGIELDLVWSSAYNTILIDNSDLLHT